MSHNRQYAIMSLELHLFFARIMKEHSLFLEAGFTPVDATFAKEAEHYKQEFEKILAVAVNLGNGIISQGILQSGEIVTEFTASAEEQTQRFTGITINKAITAKEYSLRAGKNTHVSEELNRQVNQLNQSALRLLNGLIALKERTLNNVLHCRMFTMNYPLLLEHIIREAKLYRTYVTGLQSGTAMSNQDMKQIEQFWNQIMMEHAMFIRGLLDPSENELINTSDSFAKDYARLLAKSREMNDATIATADALQETIKFRDFKAAGAKGIQECKIRSIILPLLADHVLREANHYIRILKPI